jgi:hypothetical protein
MPRLLSAAALSALHASLISDSVSFSSCCTSVTRQEVVKASKVQTEFRWSVQEVCVGDLLLEC